MGAEGVVGDHGEELEVVNLPVVALKAVGIGGGSSWRTSTGEKFGGG